MSTTCKGCLNALPGKIFRAYPANLKYCVICGKMMQFTGKDEPRLTGDKDYDQE